MRIAIASVLLALISAGSLYAAKRPLSLAGVIAYVSACCSIPTEPLSPRERFEPPEIYKTYWDQLQSCSGLHGRDFNDITFYHVPERSLGGKVVAKAMIERYEILIPKFYENSESIVKHEMMHLLITKPGHPDLYFRILCHDLMKDGE